jgi:hypothetical protein
MSDEKRRALAIFFQEPPIVDGKYGTIAIGDIHFMLVIRQGDQSQPFLAANIFEIVIKEYRPIGTKASEATTSTVLQWCRRFEQAILHAVTGLHEIRRLASTEELFQFDLPSNHPAWKSFTQAIGEAVEVAKVLLDVAKMINGRSQDIVEFLAEPLRIESQFEEVIFCARRIGVQFQTISTAGNRAQPNDALSTAGEFQRFVRERDLLAEAFVQRDQQNAFNWKNTAQAVGLSDDLAEKIIEAWANLGILKTEAETTKTSFSPQGLELAQQMHQKRLEANKRMAEATYVEWPSSGPVRKERKFNDSTTRGTLFICYCHDDKKFLAQILDHLKPLERACDIQKWSDQDISPGSKWFAEIQSALTRTKVAVLLVTPRFLASDFIHEHELGPLLKTAAQGGVIILWVPVRSCNFKDTPLRDLQAVISPDKPLAEMKAERDRAWVLVCEAIKKAMEKLPEAS